MQSEMRLNHVLLVALSIQERGEKEDPALVPLINILKHSS